MASYTCCSVACYAFPHEVQYVDAHARILLDRWGRSDRSLPSVSSVHAPAPGTYEYKQGGPYVIFDEEDAPSNPFLATYLYEDTIILVAFHPVAPAPDFRERGPDEVPEVEATKKSDRVVHGSCGYGRAYLHVLEGYDATETTWLAAASSRMRADARSMLKDGSTVILRRLSEEDYSVEGPADSASFESWLAHPLRLIMFRCRAVHHRNEIRGTPKRLYLNSFNINTAYSNFDQEWSAAIGTPSESLDGFGWKDLLRDAGDTQIKYCTDSVNDGRKPIPISVFLASSKDLKNDRDYFRNEFRNRFEDVYRRRGYEIDIVLWEELSTALRANGSQAEYNRRVDSCDIFVCLFFSRAGEHTVEEFDTAREKHLKTNGRPQIHVYFKNAAVSLTELLEKDEISGVRKFWKELEGIKHFTGWYESASDLFVQFLRELENHIEGTLVERSPENSSS
jgi:hypothetical protein